MREGADEAHQLYRVAFAGAEHVWHLGHIGVAGSVLYANPIANASMPPPTGWRASGSASYLPAPRWVRCADQP